MRRDEPGEEADRAVAVEGYVEARAATSEHVRAPDCAAMASSPRSRWSRAWPKRRARFSLCVAITSVVPSLFISSKSRIRRSAISSSTLPVGSSASSRLGPADYRARDGEALLLSARERRWPGVELLGKPDPAQQLAHMFLDLAARRRRRRVAARRRCRRRTGARSGGSPGRRRRSCGGAPGVRRAASWRCRGRTGTRGRASAARRDT